MNGLEPRRYSGLVDIDAGSLLLSLAVSGVGFIFFSYGKKMVRGPQIFFGLVLMVFPFFITTAWIMGAVAAGLLALLWLTLYLGW